MGQGHRVKGTQDHVIYDKDTPFVITNNLIYLRNVLPGVMTCYEPVSKKVN
jgi:hypothetical protein